MDKLTIKEVAPYLPYGLNYEYINFLKESKREVFDCEFFSLGIFRLDALKLVLRPMDDLIVFIKIGSVEICPIVELAKIVDGSLISNLKIKSDGKNFGIKYLDSDSIETVFCFHTEINSFGIHTPFDNNFHLVSNQLELFQKLFEWHFDVFGLIEMGLAVKL